MTVDKAYEHVRYLMRSLTIHNIRDAQLFYKGSLITDIQHLSDALYNVCTERDSWWLGVMGYDNIYERND